MEKESILSNPRPCAKEKTEMAVELYCRQNDMDYGVEKSAALKEVEDVTLIQYNGEYHG
ncbi:MAG: hypothetical protein ACLURP_01070 [Ruminococcus sp.]